MPDEAIGRVRYATSDAVALVTLDRPHKRNALNGPLLEALLAALRRAAADSSVRAVVLSGTGVFSAGADLTELADARAYRDGMGRLFAETAITIRTSRLPMVAAVEGYALGGALLVALSCDIVVLSESAFVALPEIEVGLIGGVSTVRELAGRQVAARLCLLGERMSAPDAARLGLGTLVEPGTTLATASKIAGRIAAHDEQAVATVKRRLAEGAALEALWAERDANVDLMASRQPLPDGIAPTPGPAGSSTSD